MIEIQELADIINNGMYYTDNASVIKEYEIRNSDFWKNSLSGVIVKTSLNTLKDFENIATRPIYAIRGHQITPEQARKIILVTDNKIKYKPKIKSSYFYNNWVPYNRADKEEVVYGWCHPDGYIGLNHYLYVQAPFMESLVYPWMQVAKLFPFLDLVVILTDKSEKPDKFRFLGYNDILSFRSHIVCGIKVKNREIELLSARDAEGYYKTYDAAYGIHDVKYYKYFNGKDRYIGEQLENKPNPITMRNWQEEAKEFISYPCLDVDVPNKNIEKYYFKADHNSPAYNGHPTKEYYIQLLNFLGITEDNLIGVNKQLTKPVKHKTLKEKLKLNKAPKPKMNKAPKPKFNKGGN